MGLSNQIFCICSYIIFVVSLGIEGYIPLKFYRNSRLEIFSSYKSDDNPFTRTVAPEIPLSTDVSQLPDSFSGL